MSTVILLVTARTHDLFDNCAVAFIELFHFICHCAMEDAEVLRIESLFATILIPLFDAFDAHTELY